MTNNEIIKALECCQSTTAECKNCPMPKDIRDDCWCMETISRNALSLINRQKAEIERLEKEAFTYKIMWAKAEVRETKAKAEAIKEFAERLDETKFKHGDDYMIYAENIYVIKKEMERNGG